MHAKLSDRVTQRGTEETQSYAKVHFTRYSFADY